MSTWKEDAAKRRGFRQSNAGPEAPKHKSKSKQCKATKAEHKYQLILISDWPPYADPTEHIYKYNCACGKIHYTFKRLEEK